MAPTVPKKLAKKLATKPPDKEAAKKGPKTPFVKPQKAPAAKVKPEEWTEERWQEDCLRRKLSMAERRERRVVEQARKTAASLVQRKAMLAACATATAASPWSCSTSAYIPGVASPSTPGFFGEAAAATPGCLTPRYEDALAHGGFNPNAVFSPTYDEQQRQQGHGADGLAFTGRRGLLQFKGAGAPFGEEEAAREEEDGEDEEEDGDEDDEEDGDEEDEEEDAVEDAEDLVEVDAVGVRKTKKKAASTVGMDPWTLAAHNYYKGMILDEIHDKIAATEAAAATPPPEAVAAPASASATASASTPASASASASASATEQPDRAEHDNLDGPASTQDVPSSSPNCFF